MAAETALLITIGTSLTSGLLKEVVKKAIGAASETSKVSGLKSAFFGDLDKDLRRLEKELCRLDSVLCRAQNIGPMQQDNNNLVLIWLKDVKEAAFYADNLLDEICYEKIRRKVETETSPNYLKKLGGESSTAKIKKSVKLSETSCPFRFRIARKIKKFVSLTVKIHKEAEVTLHLKSLVGETSTVTNQPSTTSIAENVREIRANPDTSIVLGREADEELIVTKLCSPDTNSDFSVIAIVGRSGSSGESHNLSKRRKKVPP